MLSSNEVSFNIRYDAPDEVWNKLALIYEQMPGWMGWPADGVLYWFSNDESGESKMIYISVEPGGLQFCAFMQNDEWIAWTEHFKKLATAALGYEIGDASHGYAFKYF